MMKLMSRFVKEEEGQGLAEYGLILALIAVAVVITLTTLGENISNIFDKIAEKLIIQ